MPDDFHPDPDWETLERVAEGDSAAFGQLVERHQNRLLRLCERLLQDPEEARDATQEVFLKVYGKAATYRPQGQVYTWLYRIAVNHCLNQIRRKRLVGFLRFSELAEPDSASEPVEPAAEAPDGSFVLENRERWRATRRAIRNLPATQRAVLVLAKFEGLSYREIASVLGVTVGAVESRLFRAMRRLEKEDESWRRGEAGGSEPARRSQPRGTTKP